MKTTTRAGRRLATGFLVATAVLVSACDLAVGPPVRDVGYEHNVGITPAPSPATAGRSPGTAGRRSARSIPHA